MRTYEGTHPWITYRINQDKVPPILWLLLGEARSKLGHIARSSLRPSTATKLNQLYLARGVRATTAIEGNTLSEDQVMKQIEGTLRLPPSKEYLGTEVQNILDACNEVWSRALERRGRYEITVDRICEFNEKALHGLPRGEDVVPGSIREHSVGLAQYRGAPAKDCKYLLEKLCEWLNGPDFGKNDRRSELRPVFAILKAILAHLYIAWIHPFGDGNGRTARLLEFEILANAGMPQPAAHVLSNFYNETRDEYYRQLDAASKSKGDVIPFIHYAVQGFVDGLREQIDTIRNQQFDIIWRNFVHEFFQNDESATGKRQRYLVLAISEQPTPVAKSELSRVNARVAQAYAKISPRTVVRDVNALLQKGLLDRTADGRYRAKVEQIEAFLPAAALEDATNRT
ncbi:MAG: Fic family protein [Polyangiaceae bacterium]|nr:Fic family protein [Polyangiaceae bacterium]